MTTPLAAVERVRLVAEMRRARLPSMSQKDAAAFYSRYIHTYNEHRFDELAEFVAPT